MQKKSKIIVSSLSVGIIALVAIGTPTVMVLNHKNTPMPHGDKTTPNTKLIIPGQKITPNTSIFDSSNLKAPVSNTIKNYIPIGALWTLSNIIATNIQTQTFLIKGEPTTVSSSANIYGVVTVNNKDVIFTATAFYNISNENYFITSLNIKWSKPISNLTPAMSNLTPAMPKWDDLTPAMPKWDDLTPAMPKWDDLTPAISNLTPATSIFDSANLDVPVANTIKNHLPIGLNWTISPTIIATNIQTNTVFIMGNPITTSSAHIYGIINVAGEDKSFKALATYDVNSQTYSINDFGITWTDSSVIKPAQYTFAKFEVAANYDLKNTHYNITNELSISGVNNVAWNKNDTYVISNINTDWTNQRITATITDNTIFQNVTIHIDFHNNQYNALNWEKQGSVNNFYDWNHFSAAVSKDIKNNPQLIADQFNNFGLGKRNWTAEYKSVCKDHYIKINLGYGGYTSTDIRVYYNKTALYNISQWQHS